AAVALLARRDFATAEMRSKLRARGFATGVAEEVVAALTASGILDDRRFAENYVSWHAGRGQGPVRIGAELRRQGLAEALVDAALAAGPDWTELARRARRSRFGRETPGSGRRRRAKPAFCSTAAFRRIISARPRAPIRMWTEP